MSRYMPNYGNAYPPAVSAPVRSTASIIAIIAAIFSFVMSGRDRELIGLLLALLAVGAGLIGGVKALSPRVSGGILSIAAVLLGVVALAFAIIAGAFDVVF
jgi:hypothetical protein